MSTDRGKYIALGVAGIAAAALISVALLASGGSDSDDTAGLRVERTPEPGGTVALVVYVEDPEDNRPEMAGGRNSVRLECTDSDEQVLVSVRHDWPYTDTDGGMFEPHKHQPTPPDRIDQVEQCRLVGTDGPLEGPVIDASFR